jgi:hypothetical protein
MLDRRMERDPVGHLPGLPHQKLAPKGFSARDRRRLEREAERAGSELGRQRGRGA